jgi:hypothetical protein
MMYRIPFADPSPDRNDHVGEPRPSEALAIIQKATFQGPPDCIWPFDQTTPGRSFQLAASATLLLATCRGLLPDRSCLNGQQLSQRVK